MVTAAQIIPAAALCCPLLATPAATHMFYEQSTQVSRSVSVADADIKEEKLSDVSKVFAVICPMWYSNRQTCNRGRIIYSLTIRLQLLLNQ